MAVMTHVVDNPAGAAVVGYVTVSLVGADITHDLTGHRSVVSTVARIIDASTGAWTADLIPNADLLPAGTVYRAVIATGTGETEVLFTVPIGGGRVEDNLAEAPGELASSALAAHAALTTGAHGLADLLDDLVTAGTPDATTTTKGKVQLAGDLAGTAAAPTVPGLAARLLAASNLADVANAATARANLGLGTAATTAAGAYDAAGAAAAAQAASQPLDSDLTAIAALTTTNFGRALLVLADAAAGRTALGLGSAAVLSVGTTAGTVAAGDDGRFGGGAGALTRIAQVALASPAATIAFSAIPGTHENLILEVVGAMSGAVGGQTVAIQLNGDTAANYDWYLMRQNVGGSGANGGSGATAASPIWLPGSSAAALAAGSAVVRLNAYARTVLRKTMASLGSAVSGTDGTPSDGLYGGATWRSNAAVTDLLLTPASGNFVAGTVATLYGET